MKKWKICSPLRGKPKWLNPKPSSFGSWSASRTKSIDSDSNHRGRPLCGLKVYYSERNLRFFQRLLSAAKPPTNARPAVPPPSHGRELYVLLSACRVLFASLKVFLFYEALIFLSWSLTLIHLIIENFIQDFLMGVVTAPTALFLNAFASFQLPESLQKLSPLIPALKSNWLIMHVTVMLLSYATLICGCLLAMTFLFLLDHPLERDPAEGWTKPSEAIFKKIVSIKKGGSASTTLGSSLKAVGPLVRFADPISAKAQDLSAKYIPLKRDPSEGWTKIFSALWLFGGEAADNRINTNNIHFQGSAERIQFIENKRKNLLQKLDQLSFRAIGIGFPFLTIGILSGSVWANEAWGSYWNWDPKETWSLITWIIFAIYLHLRFTKNWNGFKSAILATIGFLSVWICFLGVNFLAKGLHSYGWLV